MDINTTNAIDKRAGGDTVLGVLQLAGVGRVIPSQVNGADANTTYIITGGNSEISIATGGLSANRNYTLGSTGAISGDVITIRNDSSGFLITVLDQSAVVMAVLGNILSFSDADAQMASFVWLNGGWHAQFYDRQPRTLRQQFFSNGSFIVPRGVTSLLVEGFGGGGGGSAGCGVVGPSGITIAGSGGGAALYTSQVIPVTPGTSMAVVIGAGGAGGAPNNNGADGVSTTFGASAVIMRGGQGGKGSNAVAQTATCYTVGGTSCSSLSTTYLPIVRNQIDANTGFPGYTAAGWGGFGGPLNTVGTSGNSSLQGYNGGGAGAVGATVSGTLGGGSGAGGGAGPLGPGAAGGSGGAGNNVGNGAAGGNGSNAGANTGGGGGGSGGGGNGAISFTSGSSGTGGNGGSGWLQVSWVK